MNNDIIFIDHIYSSSRAMVLVEPQCSAIQFYYSLQIGNWHLTSHLYSSSGVLSSAFLLFLLKGLRILLETLLLKALIDRNFLPFEGSDGMISGASSLLSSSVQLESSTVLAHVDSSLREDS